MKATGHQSKKAIAFIAIAVGVVTLAGMAICFNGIGGVVEESVAVCETSAWRLARICETSVDYNLGSTGSLSRANIAKTAS